jgi:hypothetical protein
MSTFAPTKRAAQRYTIHDVRNENSFNFYVLNRATEIFKKPTHLMIPHVSPDSGDVRTLEVPMTTNPIDLSEFATKEELLRNPELMRMIQRGVLQIVMTEEAEAMLSTPHGQLEQDRMMSDRMQRLSGMEPPKTDEDFRSVLPPEMLAKNALGDLDPATMGVTPSISDAMTMPLANEAHRSAILRNLAPMMTERDRQYVRSVSSDPEIRALVSGS